MKKRMSSIVAAALCGISLGLSGLGSAHAAGTTVLVGQGNNNVGALVWVDGANGSTLDNQAAQSLMSQITNSTWTLKDDHTLTFSKGGQTLVSASWVALDQDMTFIPLRGRSGKSTVDGTIYRDQDDPSQGFAEIFINQVSSDGQSSRCLRILTDLTFSGTTGGGGFGGNGGGNGGGTGGGGTFGGF